MAFRFDYYGYGSGSGKDGALTPSAANTVINAYAKVAGINGTVLTLENFSDSSKFTANTHVLIHASAYTGTGKLADIGYWHITTIKSVGEGSTITLDRSNFGLNHVASAISKGGLAQIVTIPEYTTVTLNAGKSITCPQFNQANGYGGIVIFKCSKELIFNGGHINLNGKGLPSASLRPDFNFESNQNYYGYENYNRRLWLTMNYPDGVAFLIAEKITCHEDSRIGNINSIGKARTLTTEDGGASIFIAAKEIANFTPNIISKTPSASGKGRSGCCIATESELPCDEGLYSYDRLNDNSRMSNSFKIRDFGNGADKAKTNYTGQLNSYAHISAFDSTGKVLTLTHTDNNGLAKIAKGALVMIRADYKGDADSFYRLAGRFILAKVLSYVNGKVTVDTSFTAEHSSLNTNRYNFQLVTIPQFTTFTLSGTNSATPKYENGRGGIVAIAVNDTCDLKGGKLLVEGKGGCPATGEAGLDYISNAQMATKLPIGEGNGSVFILAKNLVMNGNTRIGASWTGAAFGGKEAGDIRGTYGWWGYRYGTHTDAKAGSGAGGGTFSAKPDGIKVERNGGYNSNDVVVPSDKAYFSNINQGAHILIIADSTDGLNLAALSTVGKGGTWINKPNTYDGFNGGNGGCGFGGAGGSVKLKTSSTYLPSYNNGGYIGGGSGYVGTSDNVITSGGGSGGFCFIYSNKDTNQDATYLKSD